jgi:hypothetical protein
LYDPVFSTNREYELLGTKFFEIKKELKSSSSEVFFNDAYDKKEKKIVIIPFTAKTYSLKLTTNVQRITSSKYYQLSATREAREVSHKRQYGEYKKRLGSCPICVELDYMMDYSMSPFQMYTYISLHKGLKCTMTKYFRSVEFEYINALSYEPVLSEAWLVRHDQAPVLINTDDRGTFRKALDVMEASVSFAGYKRMSAQYYNYKLNIMSDDKYMYTIYAGKALMEIDTAQGERITTKLSSEEIYARMIIIERGESVYIVVDSNVYLADLRFRLAGDTSQPWHVAKHSPFKWKLTTPLLYFDVHHEMVSYQLVRYELKDFSKNQVIAGDTWWDMQQMLTKIHLV